jgi:hypothetical protein
MKLIHHTHAVEQLDIGARYPFDERDPTRDKFYHAARGIVAYLCQRKEIADALYQLTMQERQQVIDATALIVRATGLKED